MIRISAFADEISPDPVEQVRIACRRVLGRLPTTAEEAAWTAYAGKHGLANLCRVLFNSSEFLFID